MKAKQLLMKMKRTEISCLAFRRPLDDDWERPPAFSTVLFVRGPVTLLAPRSAIASLLKNSRNVLCDELQ